MEEYRVSLGLTITGGLSEKDTPWAEVPLLVVFCRKPGLDVAVERGLPTKKSPRGLRQGQMVQSFVLLGTLGGDCI